MSIDEFIQIDKTFNEAMFLTKVDNVFVKLLTAAMLDEMENVKHFISDDVYNIYQSRVDELNALGHRQMYDELNVKTSRISNIEVNANEYVITVELQSRYMDYILDLESGNKVSGNDSSRIEVSYTLRFVKNSSTMEQGMVRRCPGCGSPMDINNDGKCSYCGGIYNLEDYDWILVSIN